MVGELLNFSALFALNNKNKVTVSLCASVSPKIKGRQYYLLINVAFWLDLPHIMQELIIWQSLCRK